MTCCKNQTTWKTPQGQGEELAYFDVALGVVESLKVSIQHYNREVRRVYESLVWNQCQSR